MLLLSSLGCNRSDAPATTPTATSAPVVQRSLVVVVGDATAANFATELRKGHVDVEEGKDLNGSASLVVIAQDATEGPMPVHREIVQDLSRAGKQKVLWIQTRSSEVDDQELLELEELEARELLKKYNLPGDTIQFAVDAESAPVDSTAPTLKGWTSIVRFILNQDAR